MNLHPLAQLVLRIPNPAQERELPLTGLWWRFHLKPLPCHFAEHEAKRGDLFEIDRENAFSVPGPGINRRLDENRQTHPGQNATLVALVRYPNHVKELQLLTDGLPASAPGNTHGSGA